MGESPKTLNRVSVIIPAFNAAPDIPVALQSVFGQTFSNHEVIVVNDGSPDTPMLERALEPYRARIHYIVQENQGAGAARNTALRVARGEYVAFLDADDLWHPEFLRRQVAYLDAHPTCGLVYADALITGESPLAGRRFMETAPSTGEVTLMSLLRQTCNIPLSTVVMRRALIDAAGLFDESLRRGQDFDLWLRLAARGVKMAYQPVVLAERRARLSGLSGNPITELRRALSVLERFDLKQTLPTDARTALGIRTVQLVDRLAVEEAKQRIREANFAAARLHLAAAARRSPKLRLAMLGLRLAPRLMRSVYLALRPHARPGPALEVR
jgi:glycosyltransferase involved in cell wall biosynthesis